MKISAPVTRLPSPTLADLKKAGLKIYGTRNEMPSALDSKKALEDAEAERDELCDRIRGLDLWIALLRAKDKA